MNEKFPSVKTINASNQTESLSNDFERDTLELSDSDNEQVNSAQIRSMFNKLISGRLALYEFQMVLTYEDIEKNRNEIIKIMREVLNDSDSLSKFIVRIKEYYAHHLSEAYDFNEDESDQLMLDIFDDVVNYYKDKSETPYFLNLQIQYTEKSLHDDGKYTSFSEKMPFRISKDWYALVSNGVISFAPFDEELEEDVKSYEYNESRKFASSSEAVSHARMARNDWSSLFQRFKRKEELGQETIFNSIDTEVFSSYEIMTEEDVRSQIESVFNFSISDLGVKEQFYFLNYLKKITVDGSEKMKKFTSLYGIDGMRTFLSLEREGAEFGDDIVSFAANNESADKVFASYGALLDEADKLESFIRNELSCASEECEEIITKTRERLLNETHQYLASIVTSDNPDVVQGLEEKTVEAKALSAAFTTYFAINKQSSIENFKSFKKNTYDNNDISPELRDSLEEIYRQNYQLAGYETEEIDTKVQNLDKRLQQPTTKVRAWEFGENQVLAFAATTENPSEKSVFVSGLNINPELKTTQAARNLAEEIIKDYSEKDWNINAKSTIRNFQGYSEMGFVASDYEGGLLNITLFPNQEFVSKNLTRKELRSRVADTKESIGADGVVVYKSNDVNEIPPLLKEGYVITRSFRVRGKNNEQDYNIFALERMANPPNSIETQIQNAA